MADTINVDVISLVKVPHIVPVINMEHPAYNVPVTEDDLLQLIQFPNYNIYEAGTKKVITGRNIDDYFPHSGGGGEGGTTNYKELSNKPSINSTTLMDNKTGSQLGLVNMPATGSVGQVLSVKTVSASGAPTEFECTDPAAGSKGDKGDKGDPGDSAYEVAVSTGYSGTKEQWLTSLKGEKGDTGATGPQGPQGEKGDTGATGATGPKGDKGDKGDPGDPAAIDDALDVNSKNTVQNKVITAAINTNKTNILTLAKHMTGDLTDSDFQEDSIVAMTKTVPTGMSDYAAVKMIGGKTVKIKQLFSFIGINKMANATKTSTSFTFNGDTGKDTFVVCTSNQTPVGHKFYFKCYISAPGVTAGTFHLDAKKKNQFTMQTGWIKSYYTQEQGDNRIVIDDDTYLVGGNATFTNVELYDLTNDFGAGNEPTQAEFEAMLGDTNYTHGGYLFNAPVESVVSTSADGTNKTTLLLPDALKSLPDYGVGIDPEHCNWIDFENMVYHHDYTLYDLTGKGWTSDGNGVFHTSYPTNAKVKAYGICNNYTVDYSSNTPHDVGDMIVRDPTYNVMYVKVESGTSPDTTGTLLYYELADDKKELIDISDILHPIRVESGGTITFTNEHNLDMPNTIIYKKEVSLI